MRNSVFLVLLVAIFAEVLVDKPAEASPIFLSKLSRIFNDLGYGAGYYPNYYGGGSYGNSYGNAYGNAYGFNNRPNRPAAPAAANRQGRTYSDICQVFGRPGINTGSASGVFCPYTG